MDFFTSMHFTKSLGVIVTPGNEQQILEFIHQKIFEKNADNIIIKGKQIKYKGSTSCWRHAIFNGVDDGEFTLLYKGQVWVLSYKVYTKNFFYLSIIFSAGAGFILESEDGKWWVGLLIFLSIYGLTRTVNWIRHDMLVEDLTWGINKVFGVGQSEIKNEDSEKLKSWF